MPEEAVEPVREEGRRVTGFCEERVVKYDLAQPKPKPVRG